MELVHPQVPEWEDVWTWWDTGHLLGFGPFSDTAFSVATLTDMTGLSCGLVDDSSIAVWVPIDDSNTPSWTPIEDNADTIWTPVDDNAPTVWEEIPQ